MLAVRGDKKKLRDGVYSHLGMVRRTSVSISNNSSDKIFVSDICGTASIDDISFSYGRQILGYLLPGNVLLSCKRTVTCMSCIHEGHVYVSSCPQCRRGELRQLFTLTVSKDITLEEDRVEFQSANVPHMMMMMIYFAPNGTVPIGKLKKKQELKLRLLVLIK